MLWMLLLLALGLSALWFGADSAERTEVSEEELLAHTALHGSTTTRSRTSRLPSWRQRGSLRALISCRRRGARSFDREPNSRSQE